MVPRYYFIYKLKSLEVKETIAVFYTLEAAEEYILLKQESTLVGEQLVIAVQLVSCPKK